MFEPTARILIVDDEPDLREVLQLFFEDHNCQVFEANNGEEALKVIGSYKIDAVITDIVMPKMNGLELIKTIEKRQGQKPLLYAISGFSSSSPEEIIKAGAKQFLNKPFQHSELENLLQDCLKELKSQRGQD